MRRETANLLHPFTSCRESPSKQGLPGEWCQKSISDGCEIFFIVRAFPTGDYPASLSYPLPPLPL